MRALHNSEMQHDSQASNIKCKINISKSKVHDNHMMLLAKIAQSKSTLKLNF
jgi:5-enolpyruvylshikimate-3-phosphate synthase